MFLFAVSALGVYGIILSGWASNSRYAFFGAIRSAGQMISYEVSLGLILVVTLLCVGSLNLVSIVSFQAFTFFIVPFFPLFLMFLVSILAETNRAPFDLPEAESELVSGFNVEYSSMGFALFFSCRVWFNDSYECFNSSCFLRWLIGESFRKFSIRPYYLCIKDLAYTFFLCVSSGFFSTI
jgi:NADH:ubiquinone oxidoreductase subunit H